MIIIRKQLKSFEDFIDNWKAAQKLFGSRAKLHNVRGTFDVGGETCFGESGIALTGWSVLDGSLSDWALYLDIDGESCLVPIEILIEAGCDWSIRVEGIREV